MQTQRLKGDTLREANSDEVGELLTYNSVAIERSPNQATHKHCVH
jgi:hypothetical protein